jgi:hypothetical protein
MATMPTGPATSGATVAANQAVARQTFIPFQWKCSNISYEIVTNVAASHSDFGVYDSNKNLVCHTGSIDSSAAGQVKATATPAGVISPAGTYYAAWCSDTVTVGSRGIATNQLNQSFAITSGAGTSGVGPALGCTAGVLAATLGTVTNSASPKYEVFVVTP